MKQLLVQAQKAYDAELEVTATTDVSAFKPDKVYKDKVEWEFRLSIREKGIAMASHKASVI